MLTVGKVYSAELTGFKMYFAVFGEDDVSWHINITSMTGNLPNVVKGKCYLCKYSRFLQYAVIKDLQEVQTADPDHLDDLIDMALDKKDEGWFYKLTNQKKKMEAQVK